MPTLDRSVSLESISMDPHTTLPRQSTVSLTLNEALLTQAKGFTNNLAATLESLLADFVAAQQNEPHQRQQLADACSEHWNAVHDAIGSFADEHSTL